MVRDNEIDEANESGLSISRRRALQATGGLALGAAAFSGTASASECCVDCVRLGKVDRTPKLDDVYEFDYDGRTITITVVDVTTEDGEVVCAKFDIHGGTLCTVEVKGGPGTRIREYRPGDCECETDHCGTTLTYPCAPPMHDRNPNRELYEISNVTFYLCLTERAERTDRETGRDDGKHGDGDDRGSGGRGRGRGSRGRGRGRRGRKRGRQGRSRGGREE